MSADGLWTINFATAEESHKGLTVSEEINRGGILVISGGHVYGGGISFYYVGSCTEKQGELELDLQATRYNELVESAWGKYARIHLVARGKVQGDMLNLDVSVTENPGFKLKLTAQRRLNIQD